MSSYIIVYLCPGSGSRRTEIFKDCRVLTRDQCLVVTRETGEHFDHRVSEVMILPPGSWYSVREIAPENMPP